MIHRYPDARLEEMLELGRYVSPVSDGNTPPFSWCQFKHRFGSHLVSEFFKMCDLREGAQVLDPFCGSGTTLVKARMQGYTGVGLDISPFSVFVSNALNTIYSPVRLAADYDRIDHTIDEGVAIPDVPILKKAFSRRTLKYLFSLRNSIARLDEPSRRFYLLVLFSILDRMSKAKKAGGFLRITKERRPSVNKVKHEFMKSSSAFISDIPSIDYGGGHACAFLGDARQFPEKVKRRKFDAIFTSPPYPNRHDYTRVYALELLVGFLDTNAALKKLRYDTLRSHVEARKKFIATDYIAPRILERTLYRLGKQELNNSQIIGTIAGYFEDMYLALLQMKMVLKSRGLLGLVISNVRFAGINVPVDMILAEIGRAIGLRTIGIYVLRYRGNSSQQMSRHRRSPSRESIVIWRND